MSLIDSLSAIKEYSAFGRGVRLLWGKVISNKDPRFLGRIKVQIKELMPWDDPERLPWIYPLFPAGLGEAPLTNNFCVPEEGSYVFCMFPHRTIYFGFYFAHTTDKLRRLSDFHSEYPERYGWIDSRENKFLVNKAVDIDSIEFRFADGGLFIYDSHLNKTSYTDKFGTSIVLDRKNQTCVIHYGGVNITIEDGTIKFDAERSIDLLSNYVRLSASKILSLSSKVIAFLGKVVSSITQKFGDPLSRTTETKDRL